MNFIINVLNNTPPLFFLLEVAKHQSATCHEATASANSFPRPL